MWRAFDDVPAELGRTVVTIGNFDGVHLGHRHVLAQARETAEDLGVDTVVVVTFDPHPMAVLRPEHAPPILTSIETRARLVEEAGVDAVLVVPFDRTIAGWSPEEFIDRVLVGALHARAVVVGANFRFGSRAAGDVALLRAVGAERAPGREAEPERRQVNGARRRPGPQERMRLGLFAAGAAPLLRGAGHAARRPADLPPAPDPGGDRLPPL